MDLSRTNKMNIKQENIEPTAEAVDLRTYEAIARESEDRLSVNENPTVRLLKRRREFETTFNDGVKKSKRDNIITVKQETPEDEVNLPNVQFPQHSHGGPQVIIPMVQIPQYPLRKFGSGFVAIPDIKISSVISINSNVSIKEEPTSSLQPAQDPAHIHTFGEEVSIKQESTDQENISPNLSNAHDVCVSSTKEVADLEIGPHGTCVSKRNLDSINWMEPSSATRKLLSVVFDYQTLATHTLSGKPSPAFRERPLKAQLDPLKVADIIYFVQKVSNCSEKIIRQAITSKCSDTEKIVRRSLSKTK